MKNPFSPEQSARLEAAMAAQYPDRSPVQIQGHIEEAGTIIDTLTGGFITDANRALELSLQLEHELGPETYATLNGAIYGLLAQKYESPNTPDLTIPGLAYQVAQEAIQTCMDNPIIGPNIAPQLSTWTEMIRVGLRSISKLTIAISTPTEELIARYNNEVKPTD